jgi:hypothetical protein
MHDIPSMTVYKHHLLCVGLLAMCYHETGYEMRLAIEEAIESAKEIGMPVSVERLKAGLPIATTDRFGHSHS